MTEKQQDDTIKSRIIGLLQKGYTRGQLISDFSFAERTVDSAIKDYKEQEGGETGEPKRSDEFDTKALALPPSWISSKLLLPNTLLNIYLSSTVVKGKHSLMLCWYMKLPGGR